jgi:hypothetical protein
VNLSKLFEKRPTSKTDVVMAIGAVIVAGWKAIQTIQDYNQEKK